MRLEEHEKEQINQMTTFFKKYRHLILAGFAIVVIALATIYGTRYFSNQKQLAHSQLFDEMMVLIDSNLGNEGLRQDLQQKIKNINGVSFKEPYGLQLHLLKAQGELGLGELDQAESTVLNVLNSNDFKKPSQKHTETLARFRYYQIQLAKLAKGKQVDWQLWQKITGHYHEKEGFEKFVGNPLFADTNPFIFFDAYYQAEVYEQTGDKASAKILYGFAQNALAQSGGQDFLNQWVSFRLNSIKP